MCEKCYTIFQIKHTAVLWYTCASPETGPFVYTSNPHSASNKQSRLDALALAKCEHLGRIAHHILNRIVLTNRIGQDTFVSTMIFKGLCLQIIVHVAYSPVIILNFLNIPNIRLLLTFYIPLKSC